jgi:hypothetical protein
MKAKAFSSDIPYWGCWKLDIVLRELHHGWFIASIKTRPAC